jgi:hypothetical protein
MSSLVMGSSPPPEAHPQAGGTQVPSFWLVLEQF